MEKLQKTTTQIVLPGQPGYVLSNKGIQRNTGYSNITSWLKIRELFVDGFDVSINIAKDKDDKETLWIKPEYPSSGVSRNIEFTGRKYLDFDVYFDPETEIAIIRAARYELTPQGLSEPYYTGELIPWEAVISKELSIHGTTIKATSQENKTEVILYHRDIEVLRYFIFSE